MNQVYNANLFELSKYEPFTINNYKAIFEPLPAKPAHFYQVIGRIARSLTDQCGTAVISDEGKIKVLESSLPTDKLVHEVALENVGNFNVSLTFNSSETLSFQTEPFLYGRMVSKIVDIALCNLSKDYYKYSEVSPYIIERGEGYFDKSLRERIGVEDGRRFYRGVQVAFGKPYLLLNREIELRSWKNLLNELKILGQWWQQSKKKTNQFDFYNPPKEFIAFINWSFRNRTANVTRYPSAPIVIKEITWDSRANSKVLDNGMSPSEYHKIAQGITLQDDNQPLIKWKIVDHMGVFREQYHVPELLVVGHNFKDIRMRILQSQVSQVFDILHPHCGDQQRKIYDSVRKIDYILRNNFKSLYGSKLILACSQPMLRVK